MTSKNIKYCIKCVMPESKPDLHIDERGVCNACRFFEDRENVDWELRKNELFNILENYKSKDSTKHDCVIPVSGGKDSTYQVLKMLEFGMNFGPKEELLPIML